jgi:hypothetical protein
LRKNECKKVLVAWFTLPSKSEALISNLSTVKNKKKKEEEEEEKY